jgi:hypothetical protein
MPPALLMAHCCCCWLLPCSYWSIMIKPILTALNNVNPGAGKKVWFGMEGEMGGTGGQPGVAVLSCAPKPPRSAWEGGGS